VFKKPLAQLGSVFVLARVATIRDMLDQALDQGTADIAAARDRVREAATVYIRRRLQQLGRHFPRHEFVFRGTSWADNCTLLVFPPVLRNNRVDTIVKISMLRSTVWPSLRGLHRVQREMDALCATLIGRYDVRIGEVRAAEPRTTTPEQGYIIKEVREAGADWEIKASKDSPRTAGARRVMQERIARGESPYR
jgi:hypothetical protein